MKKLGIEVKEAAVREASDGTSDKKQSEDKLIRVISTVCSADPRKVADTTNLVLDLDLDSLRRVALVSMIEEEFGVEVAEEKIDEQTTVADLRKKVKDGTLISTQMTHVSWPLHPWVVALREIARTLLFPGLRLISPKEILIEGRKHLDAMTAPGIVIFNHVGHNEPAFIIKALPANLRKKQVTIADPRGFASRWRGFLMYFFAAAFPVQKFGGPIRYTLDLAADLLDRGMLLVYSPEGVRSETGEMGEFRHGAGALAVETGVPVYPVKVKGYREVYPQQGKNWDVPKGDGAVTLVFGPPTVFDRDMSYSEATDRMRDVLERM